MLPLVFPLSKFLYSTRGFGKTMGEIKNQSINPWQKFEQHPESFHSGTKAIG